MEIFPAPFLISCCGHSQGEICHCLKKHWIVSKSLKKQESELAEEFQGEKKKKYQQYSDSNNKNISTLLFLKIK